MSIRKAATRHEIYNDGHCVFLYDEAHRQQLIEMSAAEVVTGLDSKLDRDERQTEIAKRGLLLAYELFQDDSVCVEVCIGKPLTAREKKGAEWLKSQKARLDLPSGKLRIEKPPVLAPFDPEHLTDLEVDESEVSARLFMVTPRAWGVNVDNADLARAGIVRKQPMTLSIGERRFTVYPGLPPHEHLQTLESSVEVSAENAERIETLKREFDEIEEESWDAEPEEATELKLRMRDRRRQIDDLLYPPGEREKAPLYAWFTPFWEGDGQSIMLVLPMLGDTMPRGAEPGQRVVASS